MAVCLLFPPTTMTSIIKLPPALNICSKPDAIDSAAGNVKLDFISCGVTDLYVALKRFDRRFSNISQDVTDPVRPLASNFSPTHVAMILPKLTPQIFLPDSFGSGEVSSYFGRSHCARNNSSI